MCFVDGPDGPRGDRCSKNAERGLRTADRKRIYAMGCSFPKRIELREGLDMLKDHQSYMNQREDVHKDILDSINTKVLTWTFVEAFFLLAMALWQISYISNFFETKRKL